MEKLNYTQARGFSITFQHVLDCEQLLIYSVKPKIKIVRKNQTSNSQS